MKNDHAYNNCITLEMLLGKFLYKLSKMNLGEIFVTVWLSIFLVTRTQQMTGQSTLAPLGRSTTTTVELRSPSGKSPRTCWRGKAHFIQVCWLFNLRQWLRLLFSCRVTHDGFSTTMLSEYHKLKAQTQTAPHVLNIIAVALQNLFALLCFREQRQKDSVKMAANSFPRDMDYRQEALQDKATTSTTC